MRKEKEENLLEKTVEFLLQGRSFNMGELSDELGVARKTLYNHFHSRDELLEKTVAYFFEVKRNQVERIIEMDMSFLDRARMLLGHLAEVIGSTEQFCTRRVLKDTEVEEMYKKSYEIIKQKVARFLTEGQEEGWVRNDAPPRTISNMFFSLILGSIHNRDSEDSYASYMTLLIWGLASDKARSSGIMMPPLPGSGT